VRPRPNGDPVAPSQQAFPVGRPVRSGAERSGLQTLWWAYAIAPVVAPVLFAVFFFVLGMAALAANPNDPGTPAAVVAVPALSLTVGVVVSYFAAGVIGMPTVLLLEKRQMLNAYTIHGAALATSLVFISLSLGLLYVFTLPRIPIAQCVAVGTALFVFTAPFVLASATTFWWIRSRGLHGMSLRTLMWTVTVVAILLGAAAPLLRVFF
jgi:hypothetical protein